MRRIPDGLSKGIPLSRFDQADLQRGALVEREHTSDPEIALRIAADHLVEDPLYYQKLARMERNPAQLDEQVVSEHGDLCTIKDCCVVICEAEGAPQHNPGRERWFTDRDVITRAFDAVGMAVENAYGLEAATRVTGTLYDLPIIYNARLTRAIGRAMFSAFLGMPMPTRIELTAAYDIPPGYMHRLLVHEGCHVARAIIAKTEFNREDPHGPNWRALMVMAGEEPRATCIDPELTAQQRARAGHPEVALDRSQVNVGDRVSFIAGKRRGRIAGAVVQKTEKGAMIKDDSGGSWRVGYGLLTKETP